MATTTTNMGLIKPAVNSATDEDLWGGQWNDNADTVEAWVTREQMHGGIEYPVNKTYRLVQYMRHAGTITETHTQCSSGTCTATFKINGVALGGTANSVSSVENSQAHSTSNTFSAGATITVEITSNSACEDLSFTIEYTRTSAGDAP